MYSFGGQSKTLKRSKRGANGKGVFVANIGVICSHVKLSSLMLCTFLSLIAFCTFCVDDDARSSPPDDSTPDLQEDDEQR